jgi:NADH:ubiquinone oxidoreductase subunit 6 (subunit J)
MYQLFFSLFASLAIISGLCVIRVRNPVHSVLFLILAFCATAGLLLTLGLDFFAMVFLVVYVGAIAVLFLFVVMMLNIKLTEVTENTLRYLPIGGLIAFLFFAELLYIIDGDLVPITLPPADYEVYNSKALKDWYIFVGGNPAFMNEFMKDVHLVEWLGICGNHLGFSFTPYTKWTLYVDPLTNIHAVGQILYTYYVFQFILASLILLVAMIGAIVLTQNKAYNTLTQDVFAQNTRDHMHTVSKIRLSPSVKHTD